MSSAQTPWLRVFRGSPPRLRQCTLAVAATISVLSLPGCGIGHVPGCPEDGCAIDGECYANGQLALHDPCLRCKSSHVANAWSPVLGDGCPGTKTPVDSVTPGDGDAVDTDGDGWSDHDETSCGSDPLVADSVPSDSDLDGICDPLDACSGDPENDGTWCQTSTAPEEGWAPVSSWRSETSVGSVLGGSTPLPSWPDDATFLVRGVYCRRFAELFERCKFEIGPLAGCVEPSGRTQICEAECALRASCEQFWEGACAWDVVPVWFDTCFSACVGTFTCTDGTEVPGDAQCDGAVDCADGSDEHEACSELFLCGSGEAVDADEECDFWVDCIDGSDEHAACPAPFTCANGEAIDPDWECDQVVDCIDGSDEHAACPAPFTCADGEVIDPDWECDHVVDCADGSDEHAGCSGPAAFICANGEAIDPDWECDYYVDCFDGSDEHAGCNLPPPFICGNGEPIDPDWECDYFVDCLDGSDEHVACPAPFICADGEPIDPQWECDRYEDCDDASDEHAGCDLPPPFVCADGEEIDPEWECDFYEDCADGSDEHEGCMTGSIVQDWDTWCADEAPE